MGEILNLNVIHVTHVTPNTSKYKLLWLGALFFILVSSLAGTRQLPTRAESPNYVADKDFSFWKPGGLFSYFLAVSRFEIYSNP